MVGMMRICAGAISLLIVSDSVAQQAPRIAVRAEVCRQLVRHEPGPDVAYRPGVDVRGRRVAPADLDPAPSLGTPDQIVVHIEPDLRRFGLSPNSPLSQPRTWAGEIAFDRNGNVTFNGVPLGRPEVNAIAEACRRLQTRR
jgi:hypothetical protein